ncbi:MAG: prolyl oligopeptidase family serine peptidase [Chlorogloea purpurea SAG 13.99]|nr:prolyl oligopeptidase family serine peptidase [Chlorogloea purpurea SAG 13.99]
MPDSRKQAQSISIKENPSPINKKSVPMNDNYQEILGLKVGWTKNLKIDDVAYDIYIPSGYKLTAALPCVLVLPGWNFPRTSWVKNSNLPSYADRYGYILILPEMGKTLYESQYYRETSLRWNKVPGGQFIQTRLIPEIARRHNLLKPGGYNMLLGLSTGGRGVALISLENPDIFIAGASLSGDFSQENMKGDRLMKSVYGDYGKFPQRWLGRDNPQRRVNEWKMPLFLSHGLEDKVVPESQSRLFYQRLTARFGSTPLIQYQPVVGADHNYQYWSSQLPYVFQFFNGIINP